MAAGARAAPPGPAIAAIEEPSAAPRPVPDRKHGRRKIMSPSGKNGIGVLFAAALLGSLTAAWADGDRGDTRPVTLMDPSTKAFGKTFGEWAAEWSNWVFQFSLEQSPVLDQDGRFCDLGQRGKVWFLAGSFFGVGEVK